MRIAIAATCLTAALAAGAGAATARTRPAAAPVTAISVTHASIVYAVGPTATDCDHVELWNPDTKGTWRFGKPHPCGDATSGGRGIIAVSSSGNRVVWLEYVAGNIAEYTLKTASTTRKTPRALRFGSEDVELPGPLVLGPGSELGIPFADGASVTFLGQNGAAVFRWTAPRPVRALTAGSGPAGGVVAALLDDGSVSLLSRAGAVVSSVPFAAGAVKALALAPAGLVVQVGGAVEIRKGASKRTVPLPAGARMLDYAEGRILYRKAKEIHALQAGTGKDSLLYTGTGAKQPLASLDTHGLATADGATVTWACAVCIRF